MEKTQVLAEVQDIFRDVLDNEDIEINFETVADDIEEWDSLSHIQLIVAIEKHFHIKFNSKELMEWKTVGDMIGCIISK
jgi:acyl carrier protein